MYHIHAIIGTVVVARCLSWSWIHFILLRLHCSYVLYTLYVNWPLFWNRQSNIIAKYNHINTKGIQWEIYCHCVCVCQAWLPSVCTFSATVIENNMNFMVTRKYIRIHFLKLVFPTFQMWHNQKNSCLLNWSLVNNYVITSNFIMQFLEIKLLCMMYSVQFCDDNDLLSQFTSLILNSWTAWWWISGWHTS